jgi:hypothetical protein
VLNEGVEELAVEGLDPGLAGEHCAEVRAAPCPVSFDAGIDKVPPVVPYGRHPSRAAKGGVYESETSKL